MKIFTRYLLVGVCLYFFLPNLSAQVSAPLFIPQDISALHLTVNERDYIEQVVTNFNWIKQDPMFVSQDVDFLADDTAAQNLRDQYNADLVVLLTDPY